MSLSTDLTKRGFIHQHTSESLADVLDGPKRTIYHGIDPSADSAHAGNMVIWLLLHHLAQAGHRVIFLVGGGTGMIGDPKPNAERVLQDVAITDGNVEKIKAQAQRLIGGENVPITFVNNKDWLGSVGLLTFLRDIGKHFTVNELIKKDAIATRLGSDVGLSYTEFAYPLLQGYDYLVLNKEHGCDVQVGGSDQWGNIIAGVELIRRKEQKTVHAITVPLVVDKSTGKKFGKSEGNAIWLDAEKTSPFAFYQFWLNQGDEGVVDYLKLFTLLSLEEIETIVADFKQHPSERRAQRELALAVTAFVHGSETANAVANVAGILFSDKDTTTLSPLEKDILLTNAPAITVTAPTSLIELLVSSGLASSNREARTFIESGAITYDGVKVTNLEAVITLTAGEIKPLKRGKKNIVILRTT
ncbi:MAG: tyrosine--tRNA ligase [Patescibacteria group bacterium]